MEVLAVNFITTVAKILDSVLSLYFWVIIVAAVLSWVNPDPYNPVVRIIRGLTEPVLYRIRKWLPFVYLSGIDLSPVVLLLAIEFVRGFVIRSLAMLAMSM
ncbi:YggT family protein [Oleidesulfovibrio sp.]|uniref:YggT family protein n=1 Tax=Oleidesulfovibrio sp. TaxID=2909707 RepID=UPI003A8B2C91